MEKSSGFLRYASPNEQRTISREHLGVYHAVIIGATYQFDESFDVHAIGSFHNALRQCIQDDPFLSVTVEDQHSDKSYYRHVPQVFLSNHVKIVTPGVARDDSAAIKETLEEHVQGTWPPEIPPWKIVVLPLERSCFIGFCFSHAIGDGPAGLAFHQSFQRGCDPKLNVGDVSEETIPTPKLPFPEPFDTPERLPISWNYLLSPLIAHFLPSLIANWLGMKASVSPVDSGTWLGAKIPSFQEVQSAKSKLVIREVQPQVLLNALQRAREHDSKFTGLFVHCVARALSQTLTNSEHNNLFSQAAINMRSSIGIPQNEGGLYVSGTYMRYDCGGPHAAFGEDDWEQVRNHTQHLAESAARLEDQAIGLLRYVSSVRKWTLGKFGQARDCSFEVSNIGVVNGNSSADTSIPRQTGFVFAQPGHVLSAPLVFDLVSMRGGPLVYTVAWQAGALDLGAESEDAFVAKVCSLLEKDLESL